MIALHHFVISRQKDRELLYCSDDANERWVPDIERAKKFDTFHNAQAWARKHLTDEFQVCESAD